MILHNLDSVQQPSKCYSDIAEFQIKINQFYL